MSERERKMTNKPLDTTPNTDGELGKILGSFTNAIEWCVDVPGALPIDRDRELSALHKAEKEIRAWVNKEKVALLTNFAEYCHERYLGCSQTSDGSFEYSYDSEVVIMAEEYQAKRSNLTKKGEE